MARIAKQLYSNNGPNGSATLGTVPSDKKWELVCAVFYNTSSSSRELRLYGGPNDMNLGGKKAFGDHELLVQMMFTVLNTGESVNAIGDAFQNVQLTLTYMEVDV